MFKFLRRPVIHVVNNYNWLCDLERIDRYVKYIEICETPDICKCVWIIHPEDGEKPYAKQRKHKVEEHPDCPVHTYRGYLLHYLEWTVKHG